jgi:hypothetical protein
MWQRFDFYEQTNAHPAPRSRNALATCASMA